MGHERAFDRCMRSSVELRRIRNAKLTAMRQRKWQEIRLEREEKEKKAADEYLRRRRSERAQLATYMYSCPHSGAKSSLDSQHSHKDNDRNQMLAKEKEKFMGGNCNAGSKDKSREDIILDVCGRPAFSTSDRSKSKKLQQHHAGDKGGELEATEDFLQEALQERLENETATSLLIAEITDMKSRLDDILTISSKGNCKDKEKPGIDDDKDISCLIGDENHDESADFELERTMVNCGVQDLSGDSRSICGGDSDNEETSKVTDCNLPRVRVTGYEKEYLLESNISGERKSVRDNAAQGGFEQDGQCCQAVNKEESILERISRESNGQDADRDSLSCNNNSMHEANGYARFLSGCKSLGEHPTQWKRCPVSQKEGMYVQVASDLFPSCNAVSTKGRCVSKESKDDPSPFPMSARDPTKLLDIERSLLASIERLDVKLAIASANVKNMGRTSLVSAGYQSIQSVKSAPCVIRRKSGSDVYSVNGTMFLSRPSTSQAGRISSVSKKRQTVGITNVPKDRYKHLQTCGSKQTKKSPPACFEDPNKHKRLAAGIITLHQNAEFLFN
ncbi:hypothetical protein KP509_1Z141500 [Ceratopteris richardii]|nr:hypothetical protein KP509_1Z141500 [Ceratopteris richardii]